MHAAKLAPGPESQDDATRRRVRLLAKSLYRSMRRQGFAGEDAVALASELLALVSDDLRSRDRRAT